MCNPSRCLYALVRRVVSNLKDHRRFFPLQHRIAILITIACLLRIENADLATRHGDRLPSVPDKPDMLLAQLIKQLPELKTDMNRYEDGNLRATPRHGLNLVRINKVCDTDRC